MSSSTKKTSMIKIKDKTTGLFHEYNPDFIENYNYSTKKIDEAKDTILYCSFVSFKNKQSKKIEKILSIGFQNIGKKDNTLEEDKTVTEFSLSANKFASFINLLALKMDILDNIFIPEEEVVKLETKLNEENKWFIGGDGKTFIIGCDADMIYTHGMLVSVMHDEDIPSADNATITVSFINPAKGGDSIIISKEQLIVLLYRMNVAILNKRKSATNKS